MTTPADEGGADASGRPRPRVRRTGNLLLAGAVVGLAAFGAVSHSAGATHQPAGVGGLTAKAVPTSAPSAATASRPATSPPAVRTTPPATTRPAAPVTSCPAAADRGRSALRLVHRGDVLAGVHVRFAPARPGVLASTDVATRTVTAYVRGCDAEPLVQIAASVVDQAVQLRVATTWTSGQQQRWARLRGVGEWSQDLQRDVGAVAVVWELGTTQWWQSPLPPTTSVGPQLAAALDG